MSEDPATERARKAHDALLDAQPPGTTHAQDCEFCATTTAKETTVPNDPAPTATAAAAPTPAEIQAQIQAAVDEALTKAKNGETLAALEAEANELKAEVARLQGELTTATELGEYCVAEREQLRTLAATNESRATKAEQALQDAAAYAEAIQATETRVNEVKALGLFDDKDVDAMAEQLVGYSPDLYATVFAGYKAAAEAAGTIDANADPLAQRTQLETTAAATPGRKGVTTAASKVTQARFSRPVAAAS